MSSSRIVTAAVDRILGNCPSRTEYARAVGMLEGVLLNALARMSDEDRAKVFSDLPGTISN